MYKNAMIGTIFSVTAAILFTPPKNTKSMLKTATITPVITRGTWNEFWNASPIELD